MPISNAPEEQGEKHPRALKETAEQAKQKEKKQAVRKRYEEEDFPEPKAAGLEQNPLDTEKSKEIEEMDSILPEEPFPRYDIRASLFILAEKGTIDKDDIPRWVHDDANGEMLYEIGWTAVTLKENIKKWEKFIKEND
ncbi:hypothetical protein KJ951_03785 [Patescibacteria group bacterium]|nr:hypothetical protein [Patescibacteria group bacterium]MBU1703498.1 hypothetical protein [Patescibacteria group bacterium]MBU1954190.1 hypothetical protein [Patescibacteria group bacterium]